MVDRGIDNQSTRWANNIFRSAGIDRRDPSRRCRSGTYPARLGCYEHTHTDAAHSICDAFTHADILTDCNARASHPDTDRVCHPYADT